MKLNKLFNLVFSLIIVSFFLLLTNCESETPVCPNCTGDDDDNEISAMVANVTGVYNLKFDSESFDYHTFNFKEYQKREILAKMYIEDFYIEILLTLNDYWDNKKYYDFSEDNANATITLYSIPPEYFQYNISGNISISDLSDDEISATFNFSATTSDEKRKLTVKDGIINFKR